MRVAPGTDGPGADIMELSPIVRRVLEARIRDAHTVDDLTQEALTRLLEARQRLGEGALVPYAIVTARNLAHSAARQDMRRRHHGPRLLDLREPPRPEELVLRREEEDALRSALSRLPESDRQAFLAHELEGTRTAKLAADLDTTAGGVATRMARTRARVRVDYLLALRGVELPTLR